MQIIVDTHVHIYSRFLTTGLFADIAGRMDRLSDGREHVNVLCLTERNDCRWFREMKAAGPARYDGYTIELIAGDDLSIAVCCAGAARLYVMAGRQVVTQERLEVLALIYDEDIVDGAPVRDVINAVVASGGVPVLAWAPGKWMFARHAVVSDLLAKEMNGRLLVGDTAIRPQKWREPGLMKFARDRGLTVIAGTDPLPMAGEEKYIGTYCSALDGKFDHARPSISMKKLLTGPSQVRSAGRRCGNLEALGRLVRQRIS